jgi:DNA-binding SARP family transcriptional activator/tetratricopeptide (TPR) repeat protein
MGVGVEQGVTTEARILRFNILGPLEVWADGTRLRLGGAVQERVLAILLLEPGRLVTVARLVEAAWEGDPPATATHQVRKAVADLRRRIPAQVIVTDGPGYRVDVADAQLDLVEFDLRVQAAGQAVREGRRTAAAEELRAALALWRGAVLSGAGGPVIGSIAASLEERRLIAAEQFYELRLALGESGGLVAGLRALIAEQPLRETLYGQVMLALYRSGRQAEALEEYRRVRVLLADELGIDPGPRLAKLHEGILRESPELAGPEPPAADQDEPAPAVPDTAPVPPCTLPYGLPDFTGRTRELAELLDCVRSGDRPDGQCAQVVAIDGMGGAGKTSLAVQAAHRMSGQYPDGQLYVDLRGFTPGEQPPMPPATALDILLRALAVPGDRIPNDLEGRVSLWRTALAGRRMLLLLDNAVDAAQVGPLLPASPGCLVLITSRARLLDLDGAQWVSMGLMTPEDSATLVAETLGTARVGAEPEAAAELAELCGHLPLALRVATARLRNRPQWTIGYLVERLRDETRRMDELRTGERSVAATLKLSYLAMDETHRAAFRVLGLYPGARIDVYSAAALLGTGTRDAEDILERLLDVRLVQQPDVGLYAFHDLVRSFAQSLCGAATRDDDATSVERLLTFYLTATDAAGEVLFPGRKRRPTGLPAHEGELPPLQAADAARAWFDREHSGLLAAVALAHRRGYDRYTACLTRNLSFHLNARGQFDELWHLCHLALVAARRLDDPSLLCVTLTNLGVACWKLGRFEEGLEVAAEARDVAISLGDRHIEAHSQSTIGLLMSMLGRYEDALPLLERAVVLAGELGTPRAEAEGLTMLSTLYERWGRYPEAAEVAHRAIGISRGIGYRENEIMAMADLAFAQVGLGEYHEAHASLERARELCDDRTPPGDVALVLALSAKVTHILGEHATAYEFVDRALELAGTSVMPVRLAKVQNIVGHLRTSWQEYESALTLHTQAYRTASAMSFRSEEASALVGLAQAVEALSDAAAATEHRSAAAELFDFMGLPEHCRTY